MSKSICIISHQHLCRNPRVLKESIALKNAGYEVTILTSIYSPKLLIEDCKLLDNTRINYIFYNNLTYISITSFFNRAKNKLGRWANRWGLESKWALGYAPTQCIKKALSQNADLYICHQELPSYIGTLLLKKGKKVAFDIEDWYSKDLLQKDQKFRPLKLLQKTESTALKLSQLVYTTSLPMAKALADKYKSKMPEVIYNSFPSFSTSNPIAKTNKAIKLIWISQTIGPGRGLEEIVQSLNTVNNINFELNLRGNISDEYKNNLKNNLKNNNHRINFLSLIPNNEIQRDLVNYDIGLATEPNYPLNKDLTISNKIFHYLSVGLPVIASSTQGQLSLGNDFENLIFYFNNNEELIKIFSTIQKEEIKEKREKIFSIYKLKFDWDILEKKLQEMIINNID
jgi:hypothetical protein